MTLKQKMMHYWPAMPLFLSILDVPSIQDVLYPQSAINYVIDIGVISTQTTKLTIT